MVVVVMLSACLPSTPTILVRILLKSTICSVKCVLEKNEMEKEAVVGPLKTILFLLRNFIAVNGQIYCINHLVTLSHYCGHTD